MCLGPTGHVAVFKASLVRQDANRHRPRLEAVRRLDAGQEILRPSECLVEQVDPPGKVVVIAGLMHFFHARICEIKPASTPNAGHGRRAPPGLTSDLADGLAPT
jgi:hypothetical protein